MRDVRPHKMTQRVADSDSAIRGFLLSEVLRFVKYAATCTGVRRVAVVGSLVGWLISTPNTADPILWSLAAIGVVSLGFGIFLLHRQVERRIEEIRRL